MSRITKWKLEKTKVKVVFRLQFHATHIPQTGWEKLFISFIPTESGKATAKTTKANVRNGTCKWADPIYETTRLLQDSQSRQYDEKLYKLVVAMGSSRSSILGEATINLSDYADALKPSAVDMPLHGCNSGTILHVTVQLLTSKTGFREFEQQRELRERGLQMGTDLNRHDVSGTGKVSSPEEIPNDEMDKVITRRFRPKSKEIPSLEEVGLNEDYTDSAVGFDGSSSTSGSLYTEKHDASSAHEIDSLKSTVSGDLNGLLHCQSFQTEKGDPSNHRNLAQGSSDWVQGWGSDYSMDNDLAIAYEENSRLRGSLEVAESSIFELKLEVSSLQSHADELGVETQKIAHQLAAEIASGEKLEKEVLVMKSECSKLKDDLEGLKNLKLSYQSTDATDAMDGKTFELLRQLEEAKVERESLARKMDQMECYYEALIQELEENQKQMLGELQNLRDEHSKCLCTISTNKAEIESVRQDMTEQIIRFSEERRDVDSLTKELERRAINSEAALKRARLNYSISVDQLQKDLELLSFQVLSMYETNGNLIKQTFSETSQPCFKGYPYIVQNQVGVKEGGDVLLDDLKKSLCLQEDLNQKVEGELSEMNLTNLYLDVFSKILQETLLEANIDIRLMKEKMDEFARQFEISTVSRDLLMVKLQTAMDDIHTLNEFKASCIAKCSDMLLQNQILEAKLESVSKEKCLLKQKITEYEALTMEYRGYESKYEACSAEKLELENVLKLETLKKGDLQNEMSSLKEELKTFKDGFNDMAVSKENLQRIINFLKDKLCSLLASYDEQFSGLSLLSNFQYQSGEFEDFKGIIMQLEEIQHNACKKTLQLMEEKNDIEYHRDATEVSLSTARSEILRMKQQFKHDIQDMVAKLDVSNALVEKLQLELESVSYKFQISSEVEEKYAQQNKEVFADLALFDLELQKLTSKNRDLAQEILGLDTIAEELGKSKLSIAELIQEKQDLTMSLQGKNEESSKLIYELDSLKESLTCLHDELHVERGFREKLEGTVTDLTSQLNEEHGKCLEKLQKDSSCLTDLKSQLSEMHEYLISAEVKLTFVRTQYKTWIEMLVQQLQSSDGHHSELQKKHLAIEEILNRCLASEAHYIEENGKLVITLDSLRSELEISISQNRVFSDSNNYMTVQLEECKKRLETLEVSFSDDNNRHALQEEQLKHLLENAAEEIGNLIFSKEELEIIVIVLKAKLEEQYSHLTMLEDYSDESMMLRNQCNDLTHRLSEQILKTEEFKNLSIHLKELKDKADAECLLARERREPEGPSVVMQDSLRIAFLKEQYETKLQELRQQLSISKKHGEEMLWKLQDVVDEIENRKKSEASHLKINEELSFKLLELEAELQSVLSDKREKIKAYDRIKAELDCALLSLECCKEEKENLEASLHECMEEKSKIAVELTLRKGQLESSTSPPSIQKKENGGGPECLDQNSLMDSEELQDASSLPIGEGEYSTELMNAQSIQGVLLSKSLHGIPEHAFLGQGDLPLGNSKNLTIINDHFRAQSLKSSMEHLHEELERMKNENSLLQQTNFDPKFQDLQRELMQLQKANQELGSVFPSFNESSGSGNAFERVLALEIDFAETLRAKKKSSIHFQSSFLKQYCDEEAVFRIFRDINELIKDMLELKGRYAAVEMDLKEMHDRYSQLSLQFAEVEGERQKLMMTLKNVRTSKKLSRSSSATLGDPS